MLPFRIVHIVLLRCCVRIGFFRNTSDNKKEHVFNKVMKQVSTTDETGEHDKLEYDYKSGF